jgi:hypothetical protein
MGVVRCPKHKIPYNDANPRGCPACARDKDKGGDEAAIRELQRASRIARGVEEPQPPAGLPLVEFLTTQTEPRPRTESRLAKIRARLGRHRYEAITSLIIVVLLGVLYVVTRPRFIAAPHPPAAMAEPRPLPVQPNASITSVMELLGPRQPEAVPGSPQLARYSYGTHLTVDAINGRLYSLNVGVGTRSWRGVAVGLPEREVRGTLALLGPVRESADTDPVPPTTVAGYTVYPSLEQRPSRTLSVPVRPPNGCFDVEVTLRPRVAGILVKGDTRYAVIGKGEVALDWTSTEYRIINRELLGSGSAATCAQ